MPIILLVPIHLDALYLKNDQTVVAAAANFARLPYSNGQQDFNADIAPISEEILPVPFQNQNLRLRAGIHLHWALPDTLTRGKHDSDGTTFPLVPNRWLVSRSQLTSSGERVIAGQWVVESDYLAPEGEQTELGGVTFPVLPDKTRGQHQPFRFLGRAVPLVDWLPHDPEAAYLPELTAVGYGEPTFAAFYPNCHTVFGFYDGVDVNDLPDGLQYDVIGWYSREEQDYWQTFLTRFRQTHQSMEPGGDPTIAELLAAAQEQLNWMVTLEPGQPFPEQMLCFARLQFQATGPDLENPTFQSVNTTITVGNTGIEALSAHLAQLVDTAQKAIIEDQLEAITLAERLEHRQLDIGPKFREARHEKGFVAVPGGSLWTIRLETAVTQPANADHTQAQMGMGLPEPLAHQLDSVNQLQMAYDRAWSEIEARRGQLFADWYKYVLCAYPPESSPDDYPDVDEVRYYLEQQGAAPLQAQVEATGIVQLQGDELTGQVTGALAMAAAPSSLAVQLAAAVNDLLAALATYNNSLELQTVNALYTLRQIAAPRYWQPTEPVILMTGPAVRPTPRHGQDGRFHEDGYLGCHLLEAGSLADLIPQNLDLINARLNTLEDSPPDTQIGFFNWCYQPWHPFLLEWEVELFPLQNKGNQNGHYAPDFITSNYRLAENGVELTVQPGQGEMRQGANVYRGTSLLTSYVGSRLRPQLERYLEKQLVADYYQAQAIPPEMQSDSYFQEHITEILTWYQNLPVPDNMMTNVIAAYEHLIVPDFYHLAQALTGFNDALLMHKQTRQLNIADPLGFAEDQRFADAIRLAVQNEIRRAPQPLQDFNPIRSGAFRFLKLRLVDTFGRVKELTLDQVAAAEPLTYPGDNTLIALPPRLAQPARVNLRWLSAGQVEQETNSHPATGPICGWLLPNYLDNSLAVYDPTGRFLGSVTVNPEMPWEPAFTVDAPAQIAAIAQPALRQVVSFIAEQGQSYLESFITVVDTALNAIDPENFAQHQGMALLMGRPMAVVRAAVSLELLGQPAIHQGWHAFRQDLRRSGRATDGFTTVQFPIRLGEYQQLNDGLIGYWIETAEGYADQIFYAPQAEISPDPRLRTHAAEPFQLYQAIADAPQRLTMLVDPRGQVHATSGILPTKGIDIPPQQYAAALEAIELAFLTTPVLTDSGRINLPLPVEPGYVWSWFTRAETTPILTDPLNPNAAFAAAQVIREGWLKRTRQQTTAFDG